MVCLFHDEVFSIYLIIEYRRTTVGRHIGLSAQHKGGVAIVKGRLLHAVRYVQYLQTADDTKQLDD